MDGRFGCLLGSDGGEWVSADSGNGVRGKKLIRLGNHTVAGAYQDGV